MLLREDKIPSSKLAVVQYACLGMFLVFGFTLWRLQVVGKERYELLAEQNRIRTIPILAPRGKILDREGRVLVDNYPSVSALLLREHSAEELNAAVPQIALGLNLPEEEIRTRLKRAMYRPKFEPIVVKDDITPDELAFIEAHKNELPMLETIMVHRRLYPKNGFAAHMIGYVGEVSEQMLNHPRYELYNQGDIVGTSGLEAEYNDVLMGKNGLRRVEVNSRGREIRRLNKTPAVPGKALKTSIDLDVQIAAEEALEGGNGAIVAMDPRTGEILAMVSRPTFDPNAFAVRISKNEWNRLVNDEQKPLLNKAIQAQLAPGSVFKIIMAVAGMTEGMGDMVTSCGGGRAFYGRHFKCWVVAERRTHGMVDLAKAIYQSCDTFFYQMGDRLGIGRIARYSKAFGLGQKTGVDLPQEAAGLMPSEEWKIKTYKEKWYAGETISVAIGQGAVATTPIQLARAIGGIAMGGKLRRPHIAVTESLPAEFQQLRAQANEEVEIKIDPKHWEYITDAMVGVVNPGGTAPSARLEGIDWGGKTGTSQVISNTARAKLTGDKYKDNGWFTGVYPRRNPEIVVSVLIEQGEHGYMAARTAAKVVKAYVEKQRRKQQPIQTASSASKEIASMAGVWSTTENGQEKVQGGRFEVMLHAETQPRERKSAPMPAVPAVIAASGLRDEAP